MKGWASAIAVGLLVLPVGEVGAIAGTEPLIAQRDETTDARDRQRALELSQQAAQLSQRGVRQGAINLWEEALVIFRAIDDSSGEGSTLNNIGSAYRDQGQYNLALEHYQQALAILQEVGDRAGEGETLNNIGEVYYRQGQSNLALEHYQQALAILQEVGDRTGEAVTLSNIGSAYSDQGQSNLALEHYQQALAIRREVGDRTGEAVTLRRIGFVYSSQDQERYDLALDQFQQALTISREVGSRAMEGSMLNIIGSVYSDQGQHDLALDQFQQALMIHQELSQESGDHRAEGSTLSNIGRLYRNQGQYSLALEHYQQTLAAYRERGNRSSGQGSTLLKIGFAYSFQERYDLALDQFQQALVVYREVGDYLGEVETLNNISRVYEQQGQYNLALEHYQQALVIAREIDDRVWEGATLGMIGYHHLGLNQLDQAEPLIRQSVVILEAVTLSQERSDHRRIDLLESLSFNYEILIKLLVQKQQYDEMLELADRGRAQSLAEFLSPSTADQPRSSLSAQQMKRMARDRDATILVYAIVEKEIYIWAVTPAGEIAFEKVDPEAVGIPVETIDRRARNAANSIVNEWQGVFSGEQYRLDLSVLRSSGPDDLSVSDPEHLKQVYRLLIEPVEAQLPQQNGGRLIIVPHRELSTVPFAALLDDRDRFLVDRYAISVTPSLQVLDTVSRQKPTAIGPALVVGNPSPMPPNPSTGQPLEPMPASETEANAISALLNTTPLLNRQATETAVKQQLATARILHLATHGVLETDDRGVETAWLAFGPDGQNDGKLDLAEVFGSNLSAELAVLSACDTNRGDTAGEGVIGLGRAFLKAGTPTVVASLWKVPDQQTALLMEAFYEELLAGRDRADALRLAQLKVREQYPNPRYWAAFVLIGEGDRSLDLL